MPDITFDNFLGIATDKANPSRNECQKCINYDFRGKQGDLNPRQGYDLKYVAPTHARLSSVTNLSIATFFVPEIGGGREITLQIQKATLTREALSSASPTTKNILAFWIRPYWDGLAWVDSWHWLNEMILTHIQTVAVGGSKAKLRIIFAGSQNALNDFAIINIDKTPDEVYEVIQDNGIVSAGEEIIISNANNVWAEGETVVLMRNYVPLNYIESMYNVIKSEITYHKVNNDIRIGFGGKDGRIGIAIGYREKYFNLNSFDSGTLTRTVESISTINRIILDPYNFEGTQAKLDITSNTSGSDPLNPGTYYFKLTGQLDDTSEILLAEANIGLYDAAVINIEPKILFGSFNKRLTWLNLWWSDDNELFYFLQDFDISEVQLPNKKSFDVNSDSYLSLVISSLTNLMTSANAATPTTDANTTTGFSIFELFGNTDTDVISLAAATATPSPQNGTYSLKVNHDNPTQLSPGAKYGIATIEAGTSYHFDFYMYSSVAKTAYIIPTLNTGQALGGLNYLPLPATAWKHFEIDIVAPKNCDGFAIGVQKMLSTEYFAIDNLLITKSSVSASLDINFTKIQEMTDILGYSPTFNMVKSWDQAIIPENENTIYLLNPWIEKRYYNKLFFSPIGSSGVPQFDNIPTEFFHDLGATDADNLTGIVLLANLDALVLYRNSAKVLNLQNGKSSLIEVGKGCISKQSIQVYEKFIIWCGENDVYLYDLLNIKEISKGFIRDTYREINFSAKENIIATKELKDNVYIFYDGTSLEYVFQFDRGWCQYNHYLKPDGYTMATDGTNYFMKNGKIFNNADVDYDVDETAAEHPITRQWKSILVHKDLFDLKGEILFFLQSVFCYHPVASINLQFNVYLNGSATPFKTINKRNAQEDDFILPLGGNCNKFELEITEVDGASTIRAAGIIFDLITTMIRG